MRLIGMDFVSQSIVHRINLARRYLRPFLSIYLPFSRFRFCFHPSALKWNEIVFSKILLHCAIGPMLNDKFELHLNLNSKHFEWLYWKLCISNVAISIIRKPNHMLITWTSTDNKGKEIKAKEEIKEENIFLLVDNDGSLSIISGK